MAIVKNFSIELARNKLQFLMEIFTNLAQNDEKRIDLASGELFLFQN